MMLVDQKKHYIEGCMISFSGIDCCGKSTQIHLLEELLEKKHQAYEVVWSRGGYTPGIEFIKRLIRGKTKGSTKERIAYSETINRNSKKRKLLFVSSLIDLWFFYTITLRLKSFKKIVICDRYIWDTYIDFKMKYPDYEFENGFWWKAIIKTMVKPDPSFCLFIPAEESMRRSDLKEEPFPEPIEVRKKRIAMYINEMKQGRWDHIINAESSIEEVFKNIYDCLPESIR